MKFTLRKVFVRLVKGPECYWEGQEECIYSLNGQSDYPFVKLSAEKAGSEYDGTLSTSLLCMKQRSVLSEICKHE